MVKFYNISTKEYQPISFENVYLYSEYNKIRNFLVSNNQQELLKILAIPTFNNHNIEWSANTSSEIKKLDQYSKTQQDKILFQYNEFLNLYNSFIHNLKSSNNQDNKNWGELLFSLIEGTANELFFDGQDIFITWGWRLLDENSKKLIPVYSPPPSIVEDMKPIMEEEIEDPEVIPIIDEYEPFEEVEKLSWLDRFYLFLKRIWWLVPMMSVIILILVLLKSCENNECDPVCVGLDNRLDNLGYLLDNCECGEIVVSGCMDKRYKEYNPDANVDDGSCKTKLQPCDADTESGEDGITKTLHSLGQNSGTVTINYDMAGVPDKLEVFYENKRVCSTFDVPGNDNGFVGGNNVGCCNSLSFYYPAKGDSFCTIIVNGGSGTQWRYTLGCPK